MIAAANAIGLGFSEFTFSNLFFSLTCLIVRGSYHPYGLRGEWGEPFLKMAAKAGLFRHFGLQEIRPTSLQVLEHIYVESFATLEACVPSQHGSSEDSNVSHFRELARLMAT